MRLDILNEGYGFGTKLLFRLIRLFSRQPVPDAARFTFYRPDFYGSYSKVLTQQAMRGSSGWSVAERELMAAYVSRLNDCPFCIGAHSATAAQAFGNEALPAAALGDLESAPIEEGLRATLRMLGKLIRDGHIASADMRAVLGTGVSRQQVEDALAVCYTFNVTNRLANAFGWELMSPEGFKAGAKYLLRRGYQ
ncbi:MAG TPA: carboxymuconolactone decarboxylase family protein [Chloroflexota bacterium]|nr:carboxymuconolactone decarboxylase family protein [Chloroflexota bacterium]